MGPNPQMNTFTDLTIFNQSLYASEWQKLPQKGTQVGSTALWLCAPMHPRSICHRLLSEMSYCQKGLLSKPLYSYFHLNFIYSAPDIIIKLDDH